MEEERPAIPAASGGDYINNQPVIQTSGFEGAPVLTADGKTELSILTNERTENQAIQQDTSANIDENKPTYSTALDTTNPIENYEDVSRPTTPKGFHQQAMFQSPQYQNYSNMTGGRSYQQNTFENVYQGPSTLRFYTKYQEIFNHQLQFRKRRRESNQFQDAMLSQFFSGISDFDILEARNEDFYKEARVHALEDIQEKLSKLV